MTVNTRLQENPALQRMPKNQMEWTHYQNEMAKWVIRVAKLGDGSMTTSGGTTISGLDEIPGTLVGTASLNTTSAFGVSSSQSVSTLSAADVGSDTTITIAAHDIFYDSITLSYNSGTITGLAFSTKYHVYVIDPDKTGGAVTYLSSTTLADMTKSTDRYFVGAITTPSDGGGGTSGGGGGGGGGFQP